MCRIALLESNCQQTAEHGLAIVGDQQSSKGNAVCDDRQASLVFGPVALTQRVANGLVDQKKSTNHLIGPG